MSNMQMHFHKSKQTVNVFGVVMILLLVVLAACGNSDSNSSTGGKSTTTGGAPTTANQPTPMPTSIPGYGTTQGCPSDVVISNAPKANQSVALKSQTGTTVTTHKGDVIELRFPFGKKWTGPKSAPAQLEMQQPAGYALKSDKVCVWRFTARSAGTADLHFTSRALCKAGMMCPMYVLDVPVTVTVK
ncbi:hypothetical protein [Dictyobacter formicarum]|uniref:Proteinase inhibitor I42 chagasin domain-containing protein n=1 Tax=Dictyobacter formicarum TaxID=2778368 RepID=A0ABQ3VLF0_9CHLR|nr:hypothetical protein [Dictyobacter formicarum]GHO86920.1 hypothetical protein KSZ_49260 [Dictyobacter formicarum]